MIPLRSVLSNRSLANVLAVRVISPTHFQRTETTAPIPLSEQRKILLEKLKEELPKPYDGPERDHVNFPRRKRPVEIGKLRMGFLPDEWFTFFYKKTGVTGPYLFGTGLLTFLLSKELYVIEEELSTGIAIFILFLIAKNKFGPALASYTDNLVDENERKMESQRTEAIKNYENLIEDQKKAVWQADGQKILMEAKRENVHMQLETEYRKRLMHVYEQVKRRLDYQLELVNTRRKLEQKHMVDWIVNSVVKSITPQQEKEALQKCIEDLKVLSAHAH